jgi:hypothetical protein
MRRILLAALVAAGAAGATAAGPAAAACDPKYRPLCLNDCRPEPDLKDPLGSLIRECPD